jgi:hypothetical protein
MQQEQVYPPQNDAEMGFLQPCVQAIDAAGFDR